MGLPPAWKRGRKKHVKEKTLFNNTDLLLSEVMCVARVWLVLCIASVCHGSGYFEIQINTVRNLRGELANGTCCDGGRDHTGRCPISDQCDTYFGVCLKEYQSRVTVAGPCTFGNVTSSVMGGDSFTFQPGDPRARLVLPFNFAWTVSKIYGVFHAGFVGGNESC